MILASASPVSLTMALGAVVAYTVSAASLPLLSAQVARAALWLAWLAHGALLALGLAGEQIYFGFAPALSVTIWLVTLVYAVESYFFPLLQMRWPLAALGVAAVALAVLFPGSALHCGAGMGQCLISLRLRLRCLRLFRSKRSFTIQPHLH